MAKPPLSSEDVYVQKILALLKDETNTYANARATMERVEQEWGMTADYAGGYRLGGYNIFRFGKPFKNSAVKPAPDAKELSELPNITRKQIQIDGQYGLVREHAMAAAADRLTEQRLALQETRDGIVEAVALANATVQHRIDERIEYYVDTDTHPGQLVFSGQKAKKLSVIAGEHYARELKQGLNTDEADEKVQRELHADLRRWATSHVINEIVTNEINPAIERQVEVERRNEMRLDLVRLKEALGSDYAKLLETMRRAKPLPPLEEMKKQDLTAQTEEPPLAANGGLQQKVAQVQLQEKKPKNPVLEQ